MTSPVSAVEYDQEKAFNEEIAKVTDEGIKQKLIKMKELVVKRIQLEREFRVEQNKLEAKYEKLYAPLYEERSGIINGEKTINFDEVKDALKGVTVENPEVKEAGVPEYWLTCLKNSSQFGEVISAKDEKVLKHLKDISLEYNENGNFSLFFKFSDNEFFTGNTLFRNFILDDKQNIKKIESSKIEWTSEENNPTIAKKKKKLKSKNKPSEVKTVVKVEEVESFFNFFKDFSATDDCCKDGQHQHRKKSKGEEDEDDMDENDFIEEEYEKGIFIKDELIPYSLEYYLDLVDEEDIDDDDFDEEDEEEDEEDSKPRKKLF